MLFDLTSSTPDFQNNFQASTADSKQVVHGKNKTKHEVQS